MEGPSEWAALTQRSFNNTERSFSLRYYDTQLVVRGPSHDQRLGPPPFPPQRGAMSAALQAYMREGGVEVWPEWEADSIDPVVRVGGCVRGQGLGRKGWRQGSRVGDAGEASA